MAYNPNTNSFSDASGFGGGLAQAQINNPRARPGWQPRGGPGGRRPPRTPDEWARLQAEKYIAAQVAAIEEQRKLYLDEIKRQSELEAQRGLMLSQALQGMNMPGRVQGIFGNASSDISGLAGGFSQEMQGIANAQGAEQANMVSGTGQEGAVRNEGTGMSDVFYGSQGYIPGRSMTETGAAFAAQAAMEPSYAVRFGQLEAGRVHTEGMEGLDEFTKALIEAKSQKPGLVQELLDRRSKDAQDRRDYNFAVLKEQRDWHMQQAYLALKIGDHKRYQEQLKLAQQKESRMAMQAQGLSPDGRPLPGYKFDKNGNVVKVSTKTPKAKVTPQQKIADGKAKVTEYRADIDDIIKNAGKQNGFDSMGRPITQYPPYENLFGQLWRRYSSLLDNYSGNVRKQISAYLRQQIEDALAAAGIYPTVGGR